MESSDLKRKRKGEDEDDIKLEDERDSEQDEHEREPVMEDQQDTNPAKIHPFQYTLYQSSAFKLQIDALLPNVRPKQSRRAPLDQFLLALRSHLLSLPSLQPQNPVDAARALSKQGVAVPFALPHPTQEMKLTVAFEPPSDVNVVGSWANQISVKKKDGEYFGVDLSVEMPSSLFQEKDYLDARYFHKRSYYLAVVAQSISTSFPVDVFYGAPLGDARLTVLILRPNDFSRLHTEVRIIPVLPSSYPIPLHRLSPSHSNIRIQFPAEHQQSVPCLPTNSTPIYNTAILLSTYPKLSLLSINALLQSSPAFNDAHTLLRVWANQRGYSEGGMCVHGFEGKGSWWASVLGFLLAGEEPVAPEKTRTSATKRPVGKGLSSYQLFRASLDFLAKQDFGNAPVFVKSANGHRFFPEEYTSNCSGVFVDSTSTLNYLADVPLTSLDMLRYDAQQTLEQLNDSMGTDDVFANVFLTDKNHLSKRCDAIIRVDLSHVTKHRSAFEFVEYGSSDNALLSAISRVLRRGLGNRVRAAAIFHRSSSARSISESSSPRLSAIHIGLIYSTEDAFRLVDHGPSAEDQNTEAAKEFRYLWGDKAELRRFKDGRIVESVVWEVKTSDERAHIPASIVRHLLHLHFGIPFADIQTIQTAFDAKLRLPDELARLHQSSGAVGGFKAALTAFDGLVKTLKSLDDSLPLVLSNVSPISEHLRYTTPLSPLPIPLSASLALPVSLRYLPHISIVLEFEKSSKWPDDLRAIQKIKLAFFEAIASALMESSPGLRAAVHINTCESSIQDHASLEILTPEGWLFSARIWHDREAVLLEQVTAKGQREARCALDFYNRRFIHSPKHHHAIANLAHRYTAYPGTVRLIKRWLASHWLLGTHVSEEAVELICARPFVGANAVLPETAAGMPRSKERGFSLVMEFLKEWKPEDPLFVPVYEDGRPWTKPSAIAVSTKLGAWTIATSEDPNGKMWTSNCPDIVAAHRIRALAEAAFQVLKEADADPISVMQLFSHGTNDYDVLIELKPSVLPRYYQNIDADSSVWSGDRMSHSPNAETVSRPGFDPARMLFDDLQTTYADTLKFFYDIYGGHRIGAIWLPSLANARPFRALGGFSSTPAPKENGKEKDKKDVVLNRQSILEEIERFGAGLVKKNNRVARTVGRNT